MTEWVDGYYMDG